jgi:ribonuclease P protein component
MKREYRVRKHQDFDRIIRHGEALRGHRYSLHYENTPTNETHIGIAVSKKNGGAVTRVKIKRQIRSIIAESWNDYSLPFDIVIIAKPSYQTEEFSASREELISHLNIVKESQH